MNCGPGLALFFPRAQVRHTLLGGGNINDSWLIRTESGQGWVLQRLRRQVFAAPERIMANLELSLPALASLADKGHRFPVLGQTPDGRTFALDQNGDCWRLLSYLEDTVTLSVVEHGVQATALGTLLGRFHDRLQSLAQHALHDPLPGFHHTSGYLDQLDTILSRPLSLSGQELALLTLVDEERFRVVEFELACAHLPLVAVHGDPKVANFLFTTTQDHALSLIDLDTIRPGLLLHDLGDALRSCCNPSGEDPMDPAQIQFAPDLFAAFVRGYLSSAAHLLGPLERTLVLQATWVLSFELGVRFLTDHLAGDRYFHTHRPGQNLDRARCQFVLARSILEQLPLLSSLLQHALADA
jgi:Ser/Thr protein kinase RdoA (MazF antagonist)